MKDGFRLSSQVYESLEKQCPSPIVTKDTSEHQVGYLLGVQFVLGLLRRGFTINEDNETRSVSSRSRSR